MIFRFNFLHVLEDEIDEDRPGFAEERHCIGITTFAHHLPLQYACHILDGSVPGDDLSSYVHSECGIRQEINDISQSLL